VSAGSEKHRFSQPGVVATLAVPVVTGVVVAVTPCVVVGAAAVLLPLSPQPDAINAKPRKGARSAPHFLLDFIVSPPELDSRTIQRAADQPRPLPRSSLAQGVTARPMTSMTAETMTPSNAAMMTPANALS